MKIRWRVVDAETEEPVGDAEFVTEIDDEEYAFISKETGSDPAELRAYVGEYIDDDFSQKVTWHRVSESEVVDEPTSSPG